MKKLLFVTALLLALAVCVSAGAETKADWYGGIYWELDNGGNLVVTGQGDVDDHAPWNSYRGQIKTITFANDGDRYGCYLDITRIDTNSFQNYTALTSVTLPDILERIDDSTFYGCSSLTGINIPDGVTEIGYSAFYGCSSLTGITLPDSVTKIGESAF